MRRILGAYTLEFFSSDVFVAAVDVVDGDRMMDSPSATSAAQHPARADARARSEGLPPRPALNGGFCHGTTARRSLEP